MTIATGIAKKVTYKKETVWGTAATGGATTGQSVRRVTSSLDMKKATYQSNEIRPDYQTADFRHGARSVDGSISGEVSAGTYADFLGSVCRQVWQAVVTSAAVATASAAGTGFAGTFTRASGSYITDGFKIGDVVRQTGWTATTTAALTNNSRNFWITALTATTMTGMYLDGGNVSSVAMVTKASLDSVTTVQAGKKNWMATSAQTNDSYTIEHFFSDIVQSEVFVGCRVADIDIKLPASGMATIDIGFMGKDMTTGTTAYFTSPTAVTSSGVLASVNGALFLGGVQVALVTGMNVKLTGNMTNGQVVGSNTTPDIFAGSMDVSGQMSVYFTDNVIRDMFVNETEVTLMAVFTASNAATADFLGITMSRVKVGGASKDDGEKGLQMTVPYTALLNVNGGAAVANTATTISFQDSLAV
jgi:hypothetical protein